jgi:hypothetical protein
MMLWCERFGVEYVIQRYLGHVQPLQHHNQPSAIIALFRVINRYVGNLAPMPGVFPDYPAPVSCNTERGLHW